MKRRPPRCARLAPLLVLAAAVPLGGCLVYDVASAPVKVAVGTAEVAGSVAVGTVKVAGSMTGSTIKAVARLAKAGTVTFLDVANNNQVQRVPWRQGLTLAGAVDAAKLRVAQHPVDVVRDGQVVYAAPDGAAANTLVAGGDVVRVGK